jgi:hypothetical protein
MLSKLVVMEAWAKCLTGYKSLGERIFGFARAIEAEVRKQDTELIRQMLEALKNTHDVGCNQTDAAITAANKRLNP